MKHQEITHLIINCAMKIHSHFGNGFLEKVYKNSLLIELVNVGLRAQIEKKINVFYQDQLVGEYFADLFVNDCVIVEIKTVNKIILPHILQLKNYLKATQIDTGLLLNFNALSLEYKRIFPF